MSSDYDNIITSMEYIKTDIGVQEQEMLNNREKWEKEMEIVKKITCV